MISTGNGRGEILDQVAAALRFDRSSRLSTSDHQARLHRGDGAARQRAHDQLAHPGVQRWVVEHQAGGVVLVQWAPSPYFGANSTFLSELKVCASR
jgi:hypothetical protein